jgi:hypothetical protein
MTNQTWTVGQTICIDNKDYQIQSVGRKYATYGVPGATYDTGKFYLDTGFVVQNYGAPSQVFPSRESYEAQLARETALKNLQTYVRDMCCPEHLTPEKITQILEILEILKKP